MSWPTRPTSLSGERNCACRMVDPLDGTTNFVHRWPFVCVSIGLTIKRKGQVGLPTQLARNFVPSGSTSAC